MSAPTFREDIASIENSYKQLLAQQSEGAGVNEKEISAFETRVDALKARILDQHNHIEESRGAYGDGDWKLFNEYPKVLDQMKEKIHGFANVHKAKSNPEIESFKKELEGIRHSLEEPIADEKAAHQLIGRIDILIDRIIKFQKTQPAGQSRFPEELAIYRELKQTRGLLEFFQSQTRQEQEVIQADVKANALAGKKALTVAGLRADFKELQKSHSFILDQLGKEKVEVVFGKIQLFFEKAGSLKDDIRAFSHEKGNDAIKDRDVHNEFVEKIQTMAHDISVKFHKELAKKEAMDRADAAEWEDADVEADFKRFQGPAQGRKRAGADADLKPPAKDKGPADVKWNIDDFDTDFR